MRFLTKTVGIWYPRQQGNVQKLKLGQNEQTKLCWKNAKMADFLGLTAFIALRALALLRVYVYCVILVVRQKKVRHFQSFRPTNKEIMRCTRTSQNLRKNIE